MWCHLSEHMDCTAEVVYKLSGEQGMSVKAKSVELMEKGHFGPLLILHAKNNRKWLNIKVHCFKFKKSCWYCHTELEKRKEPPKFFIYYELEKQKSEIIVNTCITKYNENFSVYNIIPKIKEKKIDRHCE